MVDPLDADTEMLNIAHRGLPLRYPENSLLGFAAAIEAKVDAIETDIRFSADGHPVLLHDASVARTTGGVGKIEKLTAARIAELRLNGYSDQSVPTLRQLLEICDGRIGLNLEIKPPAIDATVAVEAVLKLLDAFHGSVLLSSFSDEIVAAAKSEYDGSVCLIHSDCVQWPRAGQLGADGFVFHNLTYRQEEAAAARNEGLLLYCWGPADLPSLNRARKWPVNGVINDLADQW